MLKIINPKGHRYHQPSIESFLDLLKIYQNFELSDTRRKKSTFLIAEDNAHGVYGGVVLYLQKVDSAEEELHDRYEDTFCGAFATFRPLIQKFWIARICFCLEANFSPEALEELALCENFYQELYEAFLVFGKSQTSEFLAFSLCSFDTIDPPLSKAWAYMPIKLSDDMSGLTHGVLSLNKTRFMPRVPRGSCLEDVVAQEHEAAWRILQ